MMHRFFLPAVAALALALAAPAEADAAMGGGGGVTAWVSALAAAVMEA